MSDYKITIDKTEDCPYLALTVWVCDKLNSKCVGLGCEGCPFQPIQENLVKRAGIGKRKKDCVLVVGDIRVTSLEGSLNLSFAVVHTHRR